VTKTGKTIVDKAIEMPREVPRQPTRTTEWNLG
jgi:hypothetical protein